MEEQNKTSLEEYLEKLEIERGKISSLDFELEKLTIPQPFSWEEINNLKFPEDRWLVEGIFPKEGISVISSISGEGKSMILMHLARCLVEGNPWFGPSGFKTKKSRVLYINLEMAKSEIQRRGRKIGFDLINKDLLILNEDDFNLNSNNEDNLKYNWLLSFIYENKISVIIIDTLRACAGGIDENKAEEVRKFFKKFQILKNSGISIIFAEHNRKPNNYEGKKPKKEMLLGSVDKVGNLEILLMMCRDEKTGFLEFYQRKNRLGKEVPPFSVKMDELYSEDYKNSTITFEYMGEIEDDTNKKDEGKRLILDLLSDGESRHTKTIISLFNKQVGSKNIRNGLAELLNEKIIDFYRDGKQHCYFIPKEGSKILSQEEINGFFDDS